MTADASGRTVLGIDVGGTTTQVVVADERRTVLADVSAPTVRFDPSALVAATIELAARALAQAGRPVEAVGIGIPGIVDPVAGTVAHGVNLGLDATPLALGPAIAQAFEVPVAMENDVRAAALEALELAAVRQPGVRDVVYVNLGTGVAAGMIADGRLVVGPRRTAGEIGHVPFGGDALCPCGLVGCLETVLSGPALARRWPGGDLSDAARHLFASADGGDPAAVAVASAVVEDLVTLLQWLANTTGTAAFVLGGGVATAHPSILRRVHAAVGVRTGRSAVAARSLDAARIHVAPAGHPTGALGAAALARRGRTVLPAGLHGRSEVPMHDEKEHR